MGEPHRYTSTEGAGANRGMTFEQRRRRAEAIRATKTVDPGRREKLCAYCGVAFCGLRWLRGKMRPHPDRVICGSDECKVMARFEGGRGMKNYGIKRRLGGRPPKTREDTTSG
jgi:hypothetical protein